MPKKDTTPDVLEAIAAMTAKDRAIAERLHEVITSSTPDLMPKLWYKQPAYANADGKVVVFFRGADVDGERYLSLGFSENANLDDGTFWPTAYAVTEVTDKVAKKVAALVKKAVS
jgi:uncharacterized protein YdhG (YjbR/CyaY superfamily)